MEREINLSPWKSIYLFTKYDFHNLINYATLITQSPANDYFYFYEDVEKIIDVSMMPNYIKEDWLNYNKKELNISLLNAAVKDCQEKLEAIVNQEKETNYKNTLELFKSIRRELILKGLI
jgi:hypothetical protein